MADNGDGLRKHLDDMEASEKRTASLLERFGMKKKDDATAKIEDWFGGDAGSMVVGGFCIVVVAMLLWAAGGDIIAQFFTGGR